MRNFIAEVFANGRGIGQRVFDHIVKQSRRDGNSVQPHISQDVGYLKRMHKVRFTRCPCLAAVMQRREKIGAPDEVDIGGWPIFLDLINDVLYTYHAVL